MNQEIVDRVLKSPRLPSLPTIAVEVMNLVQEEDVNIKQIAETIQHDPALSTQILKIVNSSLYGQAHSISTVSHALVILGLNSVKTLALGFSLMTNLTKAPQGGFDHMEFWKRSLYSAVGARTLASKVGLVEQQEAFLGGLLQDLGMLAMSQTLSDQYTQVAARAGNEHWKLVQLERNILDVDHAAIGGILAEHWNLPPLLVAPIKYHEDPDAAPDEHRKLVKTVAMGNHAAGVFMSEDPGNALETYYHRGTEWFKLSHDDAEPLLASIHNDTVKMGRLFNLPTGEMGNPEEILARANEALLELNLRQQRQAVQLEQQNRQLTEQAYTDGLTGVANRRHFNEYLAQQFNHVVKGSGPLSLVFFDVDHFKRFNDTWGHQVGDRVLAEVASMLSKSAPSGAVVARYGGEEFALVLPGFDRISAAKLAERMRKIVETTTVTAREEALSVTCSSGVATHDGTFFTSAEQLLKAADQAVYAGKNAGRNCVRIFSPRSVAPRQSA